MMALRPPAARVVPRLGRCRARGEPPVLPDRPSRLEVPLRTFTPKPADIERAWHEVDADGAVLGRLASEVARILRGKHKAIFAPHVDTGDHVIVLNAAKVRMTAGKADTKRLYRHSGYPGGLRSRTYRELLATRPEETVRRAVKGMLPRGPLGHAMLRKLKVYAGPTHPHQAQSPKPLALDPSVRRPQA
jgi:large subunit ribosomal protein L13